MADGASDELFIEIDADTSKAESALDSLAKKAEQVGKSMDKAGDGVSSAASAIKSAGTGASSATNGLTQAAEALKKFEGIDLGYTGTQVKNLAAGLKGLNVLNVNTGKLKTMADDVKDFAAQLRNVNEDGSSQLVDFGNVGTQVKNLASGLRTLNGLDLDDTKTDGIAEAVKKISSAAGEGMGGSANLGSQLKGVAQAFTEISATDVDTTNFDKIAGGIKSYVGAVNGADFGNTGSQLQKVAEGFNTLNGIELDENLTTKCEDLATALGKLSAVKAGGIASIASGLKNLPQGLSAIQGIDAGALDFSQLSAAAQKLEAALGDLPEKMRAVADGTKAMGSGFQSAAAKAEKTADAVEKVGKATKGGSSTTKAEMDAVVGGASKAAESTESLLRKLSRMASVLKDISIVGAVFTNIARAIADSYTSYADLVESANLANTALGEYASSAAEYAKQVQSVLGINMGDWLNAEGTFMSLARGMGVCSKDAYTMSDSLTKLSYDLASFYNLDDDEAISKVQSAMSGETEAIKQLGYNMTEAGLQQVAYNNGITTSVSDMTQAEKTYVRYLALMQQLSWTHGDLAKTIQSPANLVRVLKSNFVSAAQSIGSVFLPMLQTVLPIAIAVTRVIATLANALAGFLGGSTVNDISFGDGGTLDDIGAGAEDAADSIGDTGSAADDATDSVKELKRELMGFDEINKFSSQDDSSSGSDGGSGGSGSDGGSGGIGDISLDTIEWDLDTDAFQELYDEMMAYVDKLAEIWQPAVDAVGKYWNAIADQFKAIDWKQTVGDMFLAFNDVLAETVEGIANFIGPVLVAFNVPQTIKSLFDLVTASMQDLATVIDYVGDVLGVFSEGVLAPIAEVAGNVIRAGIDALTDAFKKLGDWMSANGDVCKTAIAGILAGIVAYKTTTAAISVIKTIKPAFEALATYLIGNAGTLAECLEGLRGQFPVLGKVADAFTPKMGVLANSFVSALQNGAKPLQAGITALQTVFAGSITPIAAVVAAIAAVVAAVAWWVTQTEEGQAAWGTFCDYVSSAISSVITPLGDAFTMVVSSIKPLITALGNVIGVIAKIALGSIAAVIKVVADLLATVATVIAAVLSALSPVLNVLVKIAALQIQAVLSVITKGLNGVCTVINLLVGFFQDLGKAIADNFTTKLNNLIGVFTNFGSMVTDFFSNLLGMDVGSWFDGVVGTISGLITGSTDAAESTEQIADAVDETQSSLEEYEQKVQDNVDAINDYDDANGTLQRAMEQTGVSTEDLAKYLANTDQSVDDFVSSIEDAADNVINGFQKIDTESQVSMDDMFDALSSNLETTQQWSQNLQKLMEDTGLDASDALVQELISGGPEKYASALDEIVSSEENEQKFVESATQFGESMTNQLASTITGGTGTVTSAASAAGTAAGTSLIDSTSSTIEAGGQQTAAAASSVDEQTVSQFGSHYSEAVDAGRNLAGGFGDGVAASDMVGLAISKAQSTCSQVVAAFNGGDGYKQAKSAGENMVGGYGDGIASAASQAVSQAKGCMSDAIEALNGGTGYSKAKDAGANLMGGYKDGLSSAVSSAVQVAKSCMSDVNGALGSGTSSARSNGSSMMTSFKEGLSSAVSAAASVGTEAAKQVQSGLGSNYWGANDAGKNMMGGFKDGLSYAASDAYGYGRSASENANSGLGSRYWDAYDSGKYFGMGFEEGITSRSNSVYWSAYNMAKSANMAVQKAIKQGSPSKVMRESGKWFDLGLKVGIDDYASKVSDSARSMAVDALDVTSAASKLGAAVGEGFGDALSSSVDLSALTDAESYARSVVAQATSHSRSAGTGAPSASHASAATTTDDAYMAQTIASAVAQGLVSVQMGTGASTAGQSSNTTIVLRVGNEELARAVAKGQDSLARRGVVKLG